MWVSSETGISLRCKFCKFWDQASVFVEEFFRMIAF